MSGDQYGVRDQDGWSHGFVAPPMPSAPPPAPADVWRAVGVGLLNLSGLGLGYALVRRPLLTVVCWVATGILLFTVLPADPDGVSGTTLTVYGLFLVLVGLHGALLGLRRRLVWPGQSPLAIVLGVVLLGVPVVGGLLYESARKEAVQEMLLDRLQKADDLVEKASGESFSTTQSEYRRALTAYDDLSTDHPDSRAAEQVPDRLKTFYATVGASYEEQKYCDAVAPLEYLRTVPQTVSKQDLGSLATWPDDRLATSLYECASDSLTANTAGWQDQFSDLLTTFPESDPAAKVEPDVKAAVDKAVKAVGGDDPCTAVDQLETLGSQVKALPGEKAGVADALAADAGRAEDSASSGVYTCGVDQYNDGDFAESVTSMNDFVKANKNHKNAPRAKKIAIAAEIAQEVPAAGKKLPTTRSGGSISVTVKNDSPDEIQVMYTGPVTGTFTLKGCGTCTSYDWSSTLVTGFKPCSGNDNYPQRTISLPVGTTYFLHKPKGGSASSAASDTAKLESGYIYTECAYVTSGYGLDS
ncbi:hypothetical protein [Streptomyces adelaidensis]|uniref:hypothetical protein n=1 Tax=Streptomyces adelaidensis TaxID=2796465 RepID=UPI001F23D376|nr:hypothetical protein [Streptomyces adelaidensis]